MLDLEGATREALQENENILLVTRRSLLGSDRKFSKTVACIYSTIEKDPGTFKQKGSRSHWF